MKAIEMECNGFFLVRTTYNIRILKMYNFVLIICNMSVVTVSVKYLLEGQLRDSSTRITYHRNLL